MGKDEKVDAEYYRTAINIIENNYKPLLVKEIDQIAASIPDKDKLLPRQSFDLCMLLQRREASITKEEHQEIRERIEAINPSEANIILAEKKIELIGLARSLISHKRELEKLEKPSKQVKDTTVIKFENIQKDGYYL